MLPVIELLYGSPLLDPWSNLQRVLYQGELQTPTEGKLVVRYESTKLVFKGDIIVEGGVVTGGSIESFNLFAGSTKIMKGSGLDISAVAFVDGLPGPLDPFPDPRPIADLFDFPKKIIGSAQNDFLFPFLGGIDGDPVPNMKMKGKAGDDVIIGGSGDDVLRGGNGNDFLDGGRPDKDGGEGRDKLFGGSGKDVFLFRSDDYAPVTVTKAVGYAADGAPAPDRIKDFSPDNDTIGLEGYGSVFGYSQLSEGFLRKEQFHIGKAAKTPEQIVIYDKKSGIVYYDADGSGAEGKVAVVKLDKGLDLNAHNFMGYSDNYLFG